MKETVRVFLDGDLELLKAAWQQRFPWPFDDLGFAILPADSPELGFLRQVAQEHSQVSVMEQVEREYTKRELLGFNGYVLWVNASFQSPKGEGLEYQPKCIECGFPGDRRRTRPLSLKKSQVPRKDLASNDEWETIMSSRVALAWQAAGFTGLSFSPVLVDGVPGQFSLINVEGNLPHQLLDTLWYDGPRCSLCGRYAKSYPIHPSKELWIPKQLWPETDFAELNANLERTFNHRLLISNRAYRLLTELKATGFWVQPVHLA